LKLGRVLLGIWLIMAALIKVVIISVPSIGIITSVRAIASLKKISRILKQMSELIKLNAKWNGGDGYEKKADY
jgi:hypothetical protein